MSDQKTNKERFLNIANTNIAPHRKGFDKLIG